MSDIYELIIPQMLLSWVLCLKANLLYYCGDLETADPHACIDMGAFPANSAHLSNVGLILGQRHKRWSNIYIYLGSEIDL